MGISAIKRREHETQRAAKYLLPGTKRRVGYATYRPTTGRCETCGEKMADHPKCGACGVLCGGNHLESLPSPRRGQKLCGHCILAWERLDQVLGRQSKWEEFLSPKPSMLTEYTTPEKTGDNLLEEEINGN